MTPAAISRPTIHQTLAPPPLVACTPRKIAIPIDSASRTMFASWNSLALPTKTFSMPLGRTSCSFENAISEPAATPRMPNCGTGPRPRPSTPPSTIWHTAEFSTIAEGNFMLPVPRRIAAKVFISHGMIAPPKKICT